MQKRFSRVAIGAVAVAALAIPFAGMANADPAPKQIGTPGEKNCVGQTTAYVNDIWQTLGVNGIGNIADGLSITVKDAKAQIAAYCTV